MAITDSWIAIDFETANRQNRGSACQVGIVEVTDGHLGTPVRSYIRPPTRINYFDPVLIAKHGITADMVADAPEWPDVFAWIEHIRQGRPIIAHNAAHDVSVIQGACEATGIAYPKISFACTLVVARRIWTHLSSHALAAVTEEIGYDLVNHHEAGADALAAAHVMLRAQEIKSIGSLDELLSSVRIQWGVLHSDGRKEGCKYLGDTSSRYGPRLTLSDLPETNTDANPANPFYGRRICFSGNKIIDKKKALELVAEAGGVPEVGVTKRLDVLVYATPGTLKHKKAQEYIEKGHTIKILTEVEFLERINKIQRSESTG